VNVYVVVDVDPDSVPVNVELPDPLVNEMPPGKAPDCRVMPVESVAVKVRVPILVPPPKEPKLPEAVTHAGAGLTLKIAEEVVTVPPSGFITLI
tara:strand:- start:6 stop:287 length:282 start_codon:yes stop_codon:yes gene_type:complete